MIHKRLLIYSGRKSWVERQIYNSLPEGTKRFAADHENTITVRIISEKRCILDRIEKIVINLLDRLRY